MADDKPSPIDEITDAAETEQSALEKEKHRKPSRRQIRSLIFHLLYAAESHDYDSSVDALIENLNRGYDSNIAKDGPIATTVTWIVEHRNDLDQEYIRFFENWQFERISVATKLILRFAMWELLQTDTDPRIIINEAVELAKCFAEDDAYRFINGVLDQATKDLGRFIPQNDKEKATEPKETEEGSSKEE